MLDASEIIMSEVKYQASKLLNVLNELYDINIHTAGFYSKLRERAKLALFSVEKSWKKDDFGNNDLLFCGFVAEISNLAEEMARNIK
jgi:hypothetical protein